MRVVLDTNTVVSGLLWHGAPRSVLDAARNNRIRLYTSALLIAELETVLPRSKFSPRVAAARLSIEQLIERYANLARIVTPAMIPPTAMDPDDDHVLACAIGGHADVIVSGDTDLLCLHSFRNIPIIGARAMLDRIRSKPSV